MVNGFNVAMRSTKWSMALMLLCGVGSGQWLNVANRFMAGNSSSNNRCMCTITKLYFFSYKGQILFLAIFLGQFNNETQAQAHLACQLSSHPINLHM